MSGHNKWSTIKHKKGKADAARGKLFTKLIRELTVATREGGADADGNPRLRSAILAAKAANMPNDTIDRAVKRGAGDSEGVQYTESIFEGYGAAGVAFVVETLTDNNNRTVAEIRSIFKKHGGEMANANAVAWMFTHKGLVQVKGDGVDEDELFMAAAEAGADEVNADQDDDGNAIFSIDCSIDAIHKIASALQAAGYEVINMSRPWEANNPLSVTGKVAESTLKLMEALDDSDDTQHVYTNADISEEEMALLSGD